MQITNYTTLQAEVKKLDFITAGSPISKSLNDLKTYIGINVKAPSVIRKQAYTAAALQQWCNERGLRLQDNSPATPFFQIFLNETK